VIDHSGIQFWKLADIAKSVPVVPILCSAGLKTGQECTKKASVSCQKKAYCGMHTPTKKDSTLTTTVQKQPKAKKVTSGSIQTFCWNAIQELESLASHFEGISEVVIELQPVLNRKMVMMSHFIFTFFVRHFNNTVPVKMYPAYHKLSVYNGPDVVCTLKTPYAKRKYLSVEYTKFFLKQGKYNVYETFFLDEKKKDDLADSFLMGLCYLEKKTAPQTTKKVIQRKRKLKF